MSSRSISLSQGSGGRTGTPRSELDEKRASGFVLYAGIAAALGEFVDGYDMIVITVASIVLVPVFHLSPAAAGFLVSSAFIGAGFASLLLGDVVDRIGRLTVFTVDLILFVILAIFAALSTNYVELLTIRFFMGVGVGIDITASLPYLAEVSPKHTRGRILGSLPMLTWAFGALSSILLAVLLLSLFGSEAWRWMLGLSAIPALVTIGLRSRLPESPRWLESRGQVEDAKRSYKKFGVESALTSPKVSKKGFAKLLRGFGAILSVVLIINFVQALGGAVASVGTPYVFRYGALLGLNTAVAFSAFVWVGDILGVFVSVAVIDRISRRHTWYLSQTTNGFLGILIALAIMYKSFFLLPLFFLFGVCNWIGGSPLTVMWPTELFPTSMRGKSTGLGNTALRWGIALLAFILPVGIAAIGAVSTLLLLSMTFFITSAIVHHYPILDTTTKPLDEVARES